MSRVKEYGKISSFNIRGIAVSILLLLSIPIFAQKQTTDSDSLRQDQFIQLSVGSLISVGEEAPFWIQGNNSQRLNSDPNSLILELTGVQPLYSRNKFKFELGFDLVARQGKKTTGDIIQGYGQIHLGKLALFAGRKEEILGVRDTLLTVGPFVNGNNSLGVPKIALYTKDWINIPFTKEYFQFQFYYAHGWFEKDRAVISPFLHQKYLYLRLSNKSLPFSLFAGLTHNVQWAGINSTTGKQYASSFKDYTRVFFGKSGTDESLASDFLNALGNHLGNYDFGFDLNLGNWNVRNYWNFLYEDHSGLQAKNFKDGLTGLSVSRAGEFVLNRFLVEIFGTTNQNGNKIGGNGVTYFEPDNFFNNGIYKSGWSYKNQSLGNAMFLIPDSDLQGVFRIKSTIKGFNFAVRGIRGKIKYALKYTYYDHQGNLFENTNTNRKANKLQLSNVQINFNKTTTSNLSLMGNLNYQWGNNTNNTIGMFVGLSKKLY